MSLKKLATKKESVEIEDWGTSAHLSWGFKKISCRACLLLYGFYGDKKESPLKWLRIEKKIHTKAIVDVPREGGGGSFRWG